MDLRRDWESRYEFPLPGPLTYEAPQGVQYDLIYQSISQLINRNERD